LNVLRAGSQSTLSPAFARIVSETPALEDGFGFDRPDLALAA
jgi:hypothetical protein